MTKEKLKKALDVIGLPRLIVCSFFFAIVITAAVSGIDVASYFSSTLKYWGMWAIIVLAMIPSIKCGIGPNFGVSLGIVCGLLGSLLAIELNIGATVDTVMPGSLLYDFGDALRFGASSGAEDETDLSKIWFDMELYEAFTKGYLEETGNILTETEREYLPFSAKLLTLECGIRFLADYINGDVYFKIHKESHNIDRARNQFKLVADMETKMDEMMKVVDKYSMI